MRHHGRLASSVLGLFSTAVCASELDEAIAFGSPEHRLLDGSGGGTSGGGSSSSGGIFQQSFISATGQLSISLTVSSCTTNNWIYCQVNVFDNVTTYTNNPLAQYQVWSQCVAPPFLMTQSDTIPCTSNDKIIGAILCTDFTSGQSLKTDPSSATNVTCL